jgi:hypothetical protein
LQDLARIELGVHGDSVGVQAENARYAFAARTCNRKRRAALLAG